MMEALSSSEAAVLTEAIWHNILEDGILHSLSTTFIASEVWCKMYWQKG
jgi:hypothetical protein